MASASSTSARSLFVESKNRLADRIQVNINNIASLTRQIQRGSKTNEVNKSFLFFTFNQFSNKKKKFFLDLDAISKNFCPTRTGFGKRRDKFKKINFGVDTFGISIKCNWRKFGKTWGGNGTSACNAEIK